MVERERESLAADQLAIACLLVAAAYDSVRDFQLGDASAELFRREINERALRQGAGIADLHAADLDGEAAECRSLVGRQRRVALNDRDFAQRHIELFGGDLGQRRAHPGAEIDLAGVNRHRARGIDGDKAVDRGQRHGLRRDGVFGQCFARRSTK